MKGRLANAWRLNMETEGVGESPQLSFVVRRALHIMTYVISGLPEHLQSPMAEGAVGRGLRGAGPSFSQWQFAKARYWSIDSRRVSFASRVVIRELISRSLGRRILEW